MTCKAIQYSDEMNCAPCGLVWDVKDPKPPACRLTAAKVLQRESAAKGHAWLASPVIGWDYCQGCGATRRGVQAQSSYGRYIQTGHQSGKKDRYTAESVRHVPLADM